MDDKKPREDSGVLMKFFFLLFFLTWLESESDGKREGITGVCGEKYETERERLKGAQMTESFEKFNIGLENRMPRFFFEL